MSYRSLSLYGQKISPSATKKIIAQDLSVAIPEGKLTVIIGPNACGKSTLLRTLSRLMQPQTGAVWLNGKMINEVPTKEVAKQPGLLPQSSIAPGISASPISWLAGVILIKTYLAAGVAKTLRR